MMKSSILAVTLAVFGTSAWAEGDMKDDAMSEDPETAVAEREADLEAAERIYRKTCRACHGNRAQGVASYPRLADKEPDYIAEKLRRYRSGERIGPNSVLMIQNAKGLSDEDITNLSVYVATAFD
jgi:cytochrome c553